MSNYILGISAFYHDSATALLKDGKLVAAAQEERFTRIKHDSSFPKKSLMYCLDQEKIKLSDLSSIVFFEKPFVKFERILETYLAFAPTGLSSFAKSMPLWIKEKLFQKNFLIKELNELSPNNKSIGNKLLFSEHHLSHAASAFFPSPFEEAAILTMDGVGEWTTTSLAIGNKNKISIQKEIHFPHSLGLLYSAFTYYAGFKVNSGEYKIMGLAPYGEPKYLDLIKEKLIDIKDDGSFHLDMSYFNYCTGLTMTNEKFHNLFDGPPRSPETHISQKEMDLAASIQKLTEEVVIKLCKNIAHTTKQKNLCLAGGVALNCVANGSLIKEKIFENVWIQPAAGDAGGSLGAALAVYFMKQGNVRDVNLQSDSMHGSLLGPSFNNDEVEIQLKKQNANYIFLGDKEIYQTVAKDISHGKAVGWMRGRMEFGPRALGNRSILADPRSEKMQKNLNLKVKFRESFRPFAPSILIEELDNWFNLNEESPYMLIVSNIKKDKQIDVHHSEEVLQGFDRLGINRSQVPAITHVDYSARVQTVSKNINPSYYDLISEFYKITGCPILVNTSFNIRGEPIVCTPDDAYKCFMGTDLDILVIENFYLRKENQENSKLVDYKSKYNLD